MTINDKPTLNISTSTFGEKLQETTLKSGIILVTVPAPFWCNDWTDEAVRQKEEIELMWVRKDAKLSPFADGIVLHRGDSKTP